MFKNTPTHAADFPIGVIRCRAESTLDLIVAVECHRGVDVHWWEGSNKLCLGMPKCEACRANLAPRWQGFIICKSIAAERFGLLQFTPPVGVVLDQQSNGASGLLGLRIRMSRLGVRVNSPLHCHPMGRETGVRMFETEALEQLICRLFGVHKVHTLTVKSA